MKKFFQEFFSHQTKIEFYDYVYDRQDSWGVFLKQRMTQALSWLDGSNLSSSSRILDAGCGAGRITCEAARRGYTVFGMDYSYGMLEKASTICNSPVRHNVAFLQGDIESLPFKDSSIDMIISLGVITYLTSEKTALDEFSRVIKPGGLLILSMINKARLPKHLDLPLFFKHRLERRLPAKAVWRQKMADLNTDARVRTYFIPILRKSLELRGFTVLEYKTIPLELMTFLGREIFQKKIGIKIAMFFNKLSHIPVIGSFGGMCIFKARKNLLGTRNQYAFLKRTE